MENDITLQFGIQVPEPSDLAPHLGKGIDLPTFVLPPQKRIL